MKKMLDPHEKVTLIALLERMPTTTPCMACQNYRAGWCALDESAGKIPAEVVESGCDSWVFCETSPPF